MVYEDLGQRLSSLRSHVSRSSLSPRAVSKVTSTGLQAFASLDSSPAWTDDDRFLPRASLRSRQRLSAQPSPTVRSRPKRLSDNQFPVYSLSPDESISTSPSHKDNRALPRKRHTSEAYRLDLKSRSPPRYSVQGHLSWHNQCRLTRARNMSRLFSPMASLGSNLPNPI
jgi:hypothetical protein